MPRILTALLCAALSIPLLAHERLIAVEGAGKLEVMPDIIRISLTIEKQDETSSARAKVYVDELSSKAAAAVLATGVRDEDILSLSMRIYTAERCDDDNNVSVAGYVASRDIDLIVRDISSYSKVVQALVDAGVSEITGIEADISNYRDVKKKALALAVQDAREKAGFLAGELGAALGRVHQIGKQRSHRDYTELEEIIVTAGDPAGKAVESLHYEFQPDTVDVQASVYVEFALE